MPTTGSRTAPRTVIGNGAAVVRSYAARENVSLARYPKLAMTRSIKRIDTHFLSVIDWRNPDLSSGKTATPTEHEHEQRTPSTKTWFVSVIR
jgi:hypothetical protein